MERSWMATFSQNMLSTALLSGPSTIPFTGIWPASFGSTSFTSPNAMNQPHGRGSGLWNEEDGFYYDQLTLPNGDERADSSVRSMVGFVPLFAATVDR